MGSTLSSIRFGHPGAGQSKEPGPPKSPTAISLGRETAPPEPTPADSTSTKRKGPSNWTTPKKKKKPEPAPSEPTPFELAPSGLTAPEPTPPAPTPIESTPKKGKKRSKWTTPTRPKISRPTPSKKRKFPKWRTPVPDSARRSRRIAKVGPSRVVFPVVLKAKTPPYKKHPPTPETRRRAEGASKPILRRSPRFKGDGSPEVYNGGCSYTPYARYDADEPVFCWHLGVLYEARVVKCDMQDIEVDPMDIDFDGSRYFVQYVGFKESYNRWITPREMMKVDPASRRYFREARGVPPSGGC